MPDNAERVAVELTEDERWFLRSAFMRSGHRIVFSRPVGRSKHIAKRLESKGICTINTGYSRVDGGDTWQAALTEVGEGVWASLWVQHNDGSPDA